VYKLQLLAISYKFWRFIGNIRKSDDKKLEITNESPKIVKIDLFDKLALLCKNNIIMAVIFGSGVWQTTCNYAIFLLNTLVKSLKRIPNISKIPLAMNPLARY